MMDSRFPTGFLLNYEVMMPFYPDLAVLFVYWQRFLLRYSGWAYSLSSLFSFLLPILVYNYMMIYCIWYLTDMFHNSNRLQFSTEVIFLDFIVFFFLLELVLFWNL